MENNASPNYVDWPGWETKTKFTKEEAKEFERHWFTENPDGYQYDKDRRKLLVIVPPLKAIRRFCLECMGGSAKEVALCTDTYCELWPYRFGTDPRREKKELSDKEKSALLARLKSKPKAIGEENPQNAKE